MDLKNPEQMELRLIDLIKDAEGECIRNYTLATVSEVCVWVRGKVSQASIQSS